jgi:recombination protein RecR
MNSLPTPLKKTIDFFEKLPGIGPKTAKRLAFYLLRIPQVDLDEIAKTLAELKNKSHYCQICLNLTENKICSICDDSQRNKGIITVVEDVLDLISIETGRKYNGVYHVLHGRIDPLNYISPDDIYIQHLIKRMNKQTNEIILATNPNMEGEATAMYIKKKLEEIKKHNKFNFKITRLAYGLPIGADLEYADYMTLQRAIEGRTNY